MEQSLNWIKAAINTSKSEFHLEGCKILIELFSKKYKEEFFFDTAYNDLQSNLIEKETFLSVEV